jgi:Flp pilus assembly protein TadG
MSRLASLPGDQRGGALVEFAVVLPFMILMLVGSLELVSAYDAQRKLGHVAYAVADIVSQASTQQPVTSAGLADVITAGQALMNPLPVSGTLLTQKVESVTVDASLNVKVNWVYPAGPPITIPPNTLKANQSLVVTEADYVYTPFSTMIWPSNATLTFRKQAYLQPRFLSQIPAPTS